jgi:hypothetical protein
LWRLLGIAFAAVLVFAVVALLTLRDDSSEPLVVDGAGGWTWVRAPECGWLLDVAVGTDGTLWAGTAAGLYGFDGDIWSVLTHEDGLPTSDGFGAADVGDGWCGPDDFAPGVDAVEVAPDGTVWVATTDAWGRGGVAAYDGSTFTTYDYPSDGGSENHRAGLIVDDEGSVWLPTLERSQREVDIGIITDEWVNGVARLNADGTWAEHLLGHRIAPAATRLAVTTDGTPWVAAEDQLWRLTDDQWVAVDTGPIAGLGRLGQMVADHEGGIWASFWDDEGVVALGHVLNDEWTVQEVEDPVISAPMAVAPDGVLWAQLKSDRPAEQPTPLFGLASYDGTVWSTYPLDEDQAPAPVPGSSDLFLAADGNDVWIARRLDNEYLIRFTKP